VIAQIMDIGTLEDIQQVAGGRVHEDSLLVR
jgi:hypothetical protein